MGVIGEFNNTLLNSANTLNGIYRAEKEAQAKLDLSYMSIGLENEIKNKMLQLQNSDDYENWGTEIDNFYQQRLDQLGDKNSRYYCKNEYTANLARQMLEASRVDYTNKANVMAQQKIAQQDIVNYQNAKTELRNIARGQEYINGAVALATTLKANGRLDPQQYDSEIKNIYTEGTYYYYADKLDAKIEDAIGSGKSFDQLYSEEVLSDKEGTRLYGQDGLEIKVDKTAVMEQLKKTEQQKYNAKLAEMQTKNEQYFVTDVSDIMSDIVNIKSGASNKTVQDVVTRINIGINKNDTMTGNKLAQGKQREVANWYKSLLNDVESWEKEIKSGNSGSSNSVTSFETYIKGMPGVVMRQIANGTIQDSYAAVDALNNIYIEDFFSNEWKETKGMNYQQKQDYWNKHYSELAIMQILDSKFLKDRLHNEQQFASIAYKYDKFLADIKKHPDDYSPDAGEYIATFVYDALASSGKNTDMNKLVEEMDKQLNLVTMSKLNKLFKNPNNIVRSVKELQENDVVTTDTNGREKWIAGTKEKVDAIAAEQKNYIESTLGINLSDPQYKKVRNDIEPIPEFRDENGNIYHLETDEKGKNVNIVDQNGNIVKGKTKEELKAADKLAKEKSKEAMTTAHNANLDYTMNKNAQTNESINSASISNVMKNVGVVSENEWNSGDLTTRQIYIQDTESKINSMAKDVRKGKMSAEEFKNKVGISKEDWDKMKADARRKLILGQ